MLTFTKHQPTITKLAYTTEGNPLITRYLMPRRIVAEQGAEDASLLLQEFARQAAVGFVRKRCVLHSGGYVLLDFGAEFQGGIMITVAGNASGAALRVVFGESVSEALSDIDGDQGATNDHAIRDGVHPLPNTGLTHFRVGMTGFRFVRIEAVGGDVALEGIQGAFDYREIPYVGWFECSDERLNEIWNVAAYTVHLNMQEYLWDGIKRDRLVWIGDSNPEINTICAVFGSNDVVPRSLNFLRDCTRPTEWMNTIPSYSMWWIVDHWDWYLQNGDRDYLASQKSYLMALTEHILSQVNEDGTNRIGASFVDWSSNNTPYMKAGQGAVFVLCLRAAAKILTVLGEDEMAARCTDAAERVRKQAYDYAGNKQVAALVALADIVPAKQIDEQVLSVGGAKGFSTFLGYYGLLAKAKAGNVEGAIDLIRTYWGGMLDLGATTFWEDFDIDWLENAGRIDEIVPEGKVDVHAAYGRFCYTHLRHSLCHGWASGPAPFMSRYLLGVEVLEPGCRTVAVQPNLCGMSYLKGCYPTPMGVLEIEARMEKDGMQVKIGAPEGVRVLTDAAEIQKWKEQ